MKLICETCKEQFEWKRPPGYNGKPPTICGETDENGHWKPTPECKKKRDRKRYQKWRKNHPEKVKANNHTMYEQRKKKGKLQGYMSKEVPQPKQHPCKRCGKMSANYFYCPTCHTLLSNRISDEYPDSIIENKSICVEDIFDY